MRGAAGHDAAARETRFRSSYVVASTFNFDALRQANSIVRTAVADSWSSQLKQYYTKGARRWVAQRLRLLCSLAA